MRRALTLLFVLSATVTAQSPEGSMGNLPLPRVVKMSGNCVCGMVVASGVLSQADHEALEGYGNVGEFGFLMRPQSPFYLRVLEMRGQPVEVVFRPLKPKGLERLR